MDGRQEREERGELSGPSASAVTLALSGPTLSAPPPPDPLNPRPRGAATSEHRVTERPVGLAGSVWSASKGRAGQHSPEETKVVYAMSGCLDGRERVIDPA